MPVEVCPLLSVVTLTFENGASGHLAGTVGDHGLLAVDQRLPAVAVFLGRDEHGTPEKHLGFDAALGVG